jgi:bilirubin oxidase
MTRRAWLVGGGSAMAGLLVVARRTAPASRPVATASTASTAPGGTATVAATAGAAVNAAVTTAGTLRIPPLLSPPPRDGVRVFDLTLQRGQMAFEPGRSVDTLGINGPYLGPVLRAARGDTVAFSVTNQLGEPTTLHWHGMHLPAMMDGGPHQEIASGATWQPRFTIRQQAATLWYHPHLMGSTRDQVTRGAAGLFILDDNNPVQAALPHDYGVNDFPLIFQEYGVGGGRLGPAGQGDILVNGSLEPVLITGGARLRLRLLNATDQRIVTLGFAGDVPFHQVASDGGLLPAPVPLTRLQLAPAERAEIIVDLPAAADGGTLALQRFDGGGGGRGGGNRGAAGQGATVLTIQRAGDRSAGEAALPPLPARLNTIERLDPAAAVVTRPMVLGGGRGGRTINGRSMSSTATLHDMSNAFRVRQGDIERWNVVNASRETHVFHVHDVQFQILERNGAAPGAAEAGRKDTVVVRPGETAPLLMRFVDYADPDGPYMFHCHILQHEDQGMMGQFVVVPA